MRPNRAMRMLALAALTAHSLPAGASPRSDELKACLAALDGIAWQWPYLPPMQVRSCATAGASYDAGANIAPGVGVLGLIGEPTLGALPSSGDPDQDYANARTAAYTHFDALFRRHGYRSSGVEYADARGGHHSNTAPVAPLPFVRLARYVRHAGARTITLSYAMESGNTWQIRIEGMPPPAGKAP